jgi:hypothetical protein
VAAGNSFTVGLKSDGTVVAVGNNFSGQLNVTSWTNIVQVAAGNSFTVGLKSDGTVMAVGWNPVGQLNVGSWTNIVQVASGQYHTVGMKSDGTAVAVGRNDNDQCNVSSLTNIVQVSAGGLHTVGLKSDGTIVGVGSNNDGQLNINSWTDIDQVAAGDFHTVGLKSDGTVLAVGWILYGQCNVSSWNLGSSSSLFIDVPTGYWAEAAIYKIYNAGITTGCSQNPLRYCPDGTVTRTQMAVFLERGLQGSSFTPPSATGIFADVPVSYWAADWIEQLYNEGITTGCGTGPLRYCPENSVTSAQMAVFIVRTFGL